MIKMEVSLIDLRNVALTKPQLIALLQTGSSKLLVVLGHGTSDSIGGIGVQTFPEIAKTKFLWLYACACGVDLIHRLAERFDGVFGYCTEVLAPTEGDSTVAHKIRDILQGYDGDEEPIQIMRYVQDELHDYAFELFKSLIRDGPAQGGFSLVNAALINHTRLSLRVGKEVQE